MNVKKLILAGALALGALPMTAPTQAQTSAPIKIGFVLPMSGPFAEYGMQMLNGAKIYMKHHGETVAGRKVEILVKDDTGVAPDISRRSAQELINRDKVDVLAGFGLSPSAFAVAPLASTAKVPMVVMNAATSSITERSPYIVRASMTLPQGAHAMALGALKSGIRNVYTIVSDYGPGHDAEKQFVKTFTAGGGTIAGELRTPVKNPDYSPFLQRIRDAKPEAVFMFMPSGEQSVGFLKSFVERGLKEAGIRLIGTGDLTDEYVIEALGEPAVGLVTAFHYSDAHDSDLNRRYTADYARDYPGVRPNFMSIGGYDGMHLIYEAARKNNGDVSGDAFIAAVKGLAWESPRGPVSIDAQTRDIVQNEYLREVKRVDGRLINVEFDVIPAIKDPAKAGL